MIAAVLALALGAAGRVQGQASSFDWPVLKRIWRERIELEIKQDRLPIIDIESTFNPVAIDPKGFGRMMDEEGVTLIAMSPELFGTEVPNYAAFWPDSVHRLIEQDSRHFIPVPNADLQLMILRRLDTQRYLDHLFAQVLGERYPMMGEFLFAAHGSDAARSFSNRGPDSRPLGFPVDGPLAERLFAFSEQHGIPFQMHYEVDDDLLPALEAMLSRHPKAKVVWCHLGRVRYPAKSKRYGPSYVRKLIETYPNLYFDLSGWGWNGAYPEQVDFWDSKTRRMDAGWARLIADHPWRFLDAIDLGPDRAFSARIRFRNTRVMLAHLPKGVREIVAYKAAWKLLFGEEL